MSSYVMYKQLPVEVSMIVADGLVPNRHQAISNYHADPIYD